MPMHLHHCVCCMCIVAGRGGVVNLCHCLFLRDVKVPAWNRPAPLSGYWIQDSFASPQIAFVVDYSVGCIDSLGYSRWPITFSLMRHPTWLIGPARQRRCPQHACLPHRNSTKQAPCLYSPEDPSETFIGFGHNGLGHF